MNMLHARPSGAPSEHLDVLIVGAGLSGVDAAYRLRTGSPKRSIAVFEARDAIGGTWDLFRYPGIRSDSDMATLGFPFRPWRGEKSIVDGGAIRDYIRDTVRAFHLDAHIRLRHRVVAASWSSEAACWTIDYEVDGVLLSLTCSFLFMCSGYYDYDGGHTPVWPEQSSFQGRMVHPQFWPDDLDVRDRRVLVIGSGATAVTLVPALIAKGAAHVTMLQRSPTYIVSVPSRDTKAAMLRRRLPAPLADQLIRWKNIAFSIFIYNMARKQPDKLKALIRKGQKLALGPGYEMGAHFTPSYQPWDQRLCLVPDGDLFRVLRAGSASIVTDEIARFTENGVQLKSGAALCPEIVVTATGLTVKLMGGASLLVDGTPVDPATRMLYKGAMLEGVPNFAFAVGYTNASWTLKCDLSARFVSRLLNAMARRRQAVVRPVADAAEQALEPMLDLKSGYVERAAGLLPRQGRRAPWRVNQNYARDLLAFRTGRLRDGRLRFEPAPVRTETTRVG